MHVVAFPPNNAIVACESLDQTVRLWDVISGEILSILSTCIDEPIYDQIHFSSNQKHVIVGSSCLQTGLGDLVPAALKTVLQQFCSYILHDKRWMGCFFV